MKSNRPRITASLHRKSLMLLDMMYKPSELSEELNVTKETIIRYCESWKLPFSKDDYGHIWINGLDVVKWIKTIKESTHVEYLEKTEFTFHCVKCKFVTVESFQRHEVNNTRCKTQRLSAICPLCGRHMSKFARAQ